MHYIQPQINPRLTDRERETLVKRSVMYYSELSILSNFLRDSTIFVSEKSKLQIPTMRGSAINWRFVVVLALAVVGVMLLVLASLSENLGVNHGFISLSSQRRIYTLHAPHRKLLRHVKTATTAMKEPDRMWGERCTTADIVINQGPTGPLPSGIPTYTVEIMNVCVTGCDISGIHLNCGWFSSAHLINPKIFKRLSYNDCLVNDGKALVNGGTLSFQYANTFLYPLSVSSVVCS